MALEGTKITWYIYRGKWGGIVDGKNEGQKENFYKGPGKPPVDRILPENSGRAPTRNTNRRENNGRPVRSVAVLRTARESSARQR